ncbi:hypothetical protein BKP42_20580 [Rhodococcus erythropolis]|nr:hypothetical protein BKP42_20580 [Rhodococcus erythropolis]
MCGQSLFVETVAGLDLHVRVHGAASQRHDDIDGFMLCENSVDLTEFDPKSIDLHLEIGAADILERDLRSPTHYVTGAVQPSSAAQRVSDKTRSGQGRTCVVALSQPGATEIQFTGHTDRHWPQPAVQNHQICALNG